MNTEAIERDGAIKALEAHRIDTETTLKEITARLRELGAGPKRGRPKKQTNGAFVEVCPMCGASLPADAILCNTCGNWARSEQPSKVAVPKRKGRTWTEAQKREASRRAKARHAKRAK